MKKSRLATVLGSMNFEGLVSLRRDGFYGLQYIAGGDPQQVINKYGGYLVVKSKIVDNVLVIYVN